MPSLIRASSAKTERENAREEERHIYRLRQRRSLAAGSLEVRRSGQQFVEFIKHKKPAATVLDSRGNASLKDRYLLGRAKVWRTVMAIWKVVTRLRATQRAAFEIWAQRAYARIIITSRTLLCYAPAGNCGGYMPESTMEEVD